MPNVDLSSLSSHLKTFTMEKVLAAVLVLLVCLLVIKVVTRLTEKLSRCSAWHSLSLSQKRVRGPYPRNSFMNRS